MNKQRKVIYMEDKKYNVFRSKLIERRMTVTQWVNLKVDEFLQEANANENSDRKESVRKSVRTE